MKPLLLLLCLLALADAQGQDVTFKISRGQPFPYDTGVAIRNRQYDAWRNAHLNVAAEKLIIAQQRDLYKMQYEGCQTARQSANDGMAALQRENQRLKQPPPPKKFWAKVQSGLQKAALVVAGLGFGIWVSK
jgi:hypothetical protein